MEEKINVNDNGNNEEATEIISYDFPIGEEILLIDEGHNAVKVILDKNENSEWFVKKFFGNIEAFENIAFVTWCYPPAEL